MGGYTDSTEIAYAYFHFFKNKERKLKSEPNEKVMCSMKRSWIKSMLSLNILHQNSSDFAQETGISVSSAQSEVHLARTSMREWKRSAEVPGMCVVQRTEIPASDVIWVRFICSVSVIGSTTAHVQMCANRCDASSVGHSRLKALNLPPCSI
jgi:hypothetical protein